MGDYVTIARKDRNSEDWYLGSVTDEDARELSVGLGFLAPGREYMAEIYRDADSADYRGDRFAHTIEKCPVTRGATLKLKLAPGGGEAIRFRYLPRTARSASASRRIPSSICAGVSAQ